VCEHCCPVVPFVPRDPGWCVDFDWHHLAHGATLNQDYGSADPTCATAAFLAALDIGCHEWIA
jgi:hypothetical protein